MLDLKALLAKILNQIYNPLVLVYYSDGSRTLPANGTLTRENVDVSTVIPSGYKPVFVSFRFAGNYQMVCYTQNIAYTAQGGSLLTYQIANRINAQATVTPQFQILCVKI